MCKLTEINSAKQIEAIPEQALAWHQQGRGAVLATVIQTWGSAPRRIGGQMAISGQGDMAGSVSGGCVEGAVVLEALEALNAGEIKVLEYGISDGDAFAVGLACGGTIRVLLEPVGSVLSEPLLAELVAARAARQPMVYCVNCETGANALHAHGYEERMRLDRSGFEPDGNTFVSVHNPKLRLIIVGAVHIAQALVPMAELAGFEVYLIDPRGSFGSIERFPNHQVIEDWPDQALCDLQLDARSALVLLTHDPKLDDPALQVGLGSKAYYIGALGSTRTHHARVERFLSLGFSQAQIDRIHGPVGLPIGAATPAEIAASILAQIISTLRLL